MVRPRDIKFHVAIPLSVISNEPGLLKKTIKLGIIARFLSIFRVDTLCIYLDPYGDIRDKDVVKTILDYLLTPPYLRKKIHPLTPLLRYAGMLPPLQIPSHGYSEDSSIREGLIVDCRGDLAYVDVGLEDTIKVRVDRCRKGERLLVKAESKSEGSPVDRSEVYSGFSLRFFNSLKLLLSSYSNALRIATSKYGAPIASVINNIVENARSQGELLIVFGGPKQGIYELCEFEGIKPDSSFHYIVNTIPLQGVHTIRTEEAIAATLAILNMYIH